MAQNRLCIPQVSLTRWVHFVGVRGRKLSYTLSRTYTSTAKQATAAHAAYMRRTCAARQRRCGGHCVPAQWVDSGRNHTWPYWATGLSTTTSQKGDWQENNRSNCHWELKVIVLLHWQQDTTYLLTYLIVGIGKLYYTTLPKYILKTSRNKKGRKIF